jgi:hypothetical protein
MRQIKIIIAGAAALMALAISPVRANEAVPLEKPSRSEYREVDYAGHIGLGLMVGEPSGLNVKYWLNRTLALDAAAGGSFHDDSNFYVHGDLLVHKFDLIPVPQGQMPVYIGGGVFARFRDGRDNQVGLRVPVGVSYMFEQKPVDIFMEVAPGLEVAPSARGDFTGGAGVRFWF